MFILHALIIRGSMKGYNQLKALVKGDPKSTAALFGRIIAKQRDHYLTKEHGFNNVFKLYKQRLFSTLYPVLLNLVKEEPSREAVELMMHNCSLVSISSLQDKLQELIPIAEQAMGINEDSAGANQVKLTALQLFRKILIMGGPED